MPRRRSSSPSPATSREATAEPAQMTLRDSEGTHEEKKLSCGILRVSQRRAAIALYKDCEWTAVSSAVLNGGHAKLSAVLNTKTAADYDGINPEPESLLRQLSKDEGFDPAATVGLMTAASMETLRCASRSAGGVTIDVVVTCGISNARAAGADADFFGLTDDDLASPGTINTIVLTTASLTPAAQVEAHALAVESKCAECADVGLACAKEPGRLAQGTGTDATVVVCAAHSGGQVRYAGKHTLFAELLGQATREATREALHACIVHLYGSVARYRLRTCAHHAAALLQGARPCVPPTPSSPVPPPPLSVVIVGLCVVGLCYAAPLPRRARVLAAAIAWDRWLGEPPLRVHPVVVVGHTITALLRTVPEGVLIRPVVGMVCGALFWAAVLAPALLAAHMALEASAVSSTAVSAAAASVAGAGGSSSDVSAALYAVAASMCGVGAWVLEVLLVKSTVGGQLLGSVGWQMARLLERRQLAEARIQLSWLCSRDPSALGADELAGGALESLAENLSDGFVAPLVWYVVGGPLGALGYRVANTLDSRIGYHGRYEWFGKPAARFDDVINLLPARLTAVCLAAAALALKGCDGVQGLRVGWRDCARCESPNAGWPMATMAGLLGVRLEKAGHYSLGVRRRPLDAASIKDGLKAFQLAYAIVAVLAVGAAAAFNS